MKSGNKFTQLLAIFAIATIILSISKPALAIDDGARAYWKGREGTQGVSVQYLRLDLNAEGSQQFAPGQYIYANSDIEGSLVIANWSHHMTLFDRPSSFGVGIAGGDVDVDATADISTQFVPIGKTAGTAFSQSASGYADPTLALDVNLFGTPALKSNVDLLNYEPTLTIDVSGLLGIPIGKYDDEKLVNIGQNRWFGRLALPMKYHFGAFSPGYMTSLEFIPSIWLFAENDDFINQKLENDPMYQLEAHLTHDFTRSFWGSLDLLYRWGFQTEIDGVDVGEELDIGNLGYTLSYQVTDNMAIRTGYSSNVFGDDDLDNSMFRLQFVYGWNQPNENAKKLMSGH
jgi:Putative MetA-pathway of phenol degradation